MYTSLKNKATALSVNKDYQHQPLVNFHDNRSETKAQLRVQQMANPAIQRQENKTGMPDKLKSGIESLSGIDMSDVKVHYNSSQPAQLQAHAFAQGNQIHLGTGQEKHLPHEAWHVVQQKQGRVAPTRQLKGKVKINDDTGLEKEADVMGVKALQMKSDTHGKRKKIQVGIGSIVQRRAIPNMGQLRTGIITELNTGELAAGSHDHLLSSNLVNVNKLTVIYTPIVGHQHERAQSGDLGRATGNAYREGWYDRVDTRIRRGAQQTASDWLFWERSIEEASEVEEVKATSVELLGDELHDRGLGPAKVNFMIEAHHNPLIVVNRTYVIKPEDRSVEKAILGKDDSVASNLNTNLSKGRQVNTLDIETDTNHGTIMEYVTTNLKTLGESVLRKVHFWDTSETVTTETVALAFLTGLYDLHDDNVMSKGGAPALIDADVAARPTEFRDGPSQQAGFGVGPTTRVQNQLGGNRSNDSQILQYAINNPDAVIAMITRLIGVHRSRIVPVFTRLLATRMAYYVASKQSGDDWEARKYVDEIVKAIRAGAPPSPGLIGELGRDNGGLWSYVSVYRLVQRDFEEGVVPHFQYQSNTGQVFFHGRAIWQGQTLAQSMANLHTRLINAR